MTKVMSCISDLSPIGAKVDGARRVAEALARRLSTTRGSLLSSHPDVGSYGIALQDYLQGTMLPDEVASLRGVVARECMKDPRVDTAHVTASLLGGKLTLKIRAIGSFGAAVLAADEKNIIITETS